MGKTGIIISREYFSRVRKPSFWVMSFLPPVLFVGLMGLVLWIALTDKSVSRVAVVNECPIYTEEDFKNTDYVVYDIVPMTQGEAKKMLHSSDYTAVLYIPENVLQTHVNLFYKKQPGILVQGTIKANLENVLYNFTLRQDSIDPQKVANARKAVKMVTQKIDEQGNQVQTNAEVNMVVGYVCAILIYMFIFLYGVQVMRGVIEEKVNRIVEVIVSSVKPFQLMMGKIIGIAMVGLTQLLLWVVLSFVLFGIVQATVFKDLATDMKKIQPTETHIKMGANVTDMDLTKKTAKPGEEFNPNDVYAAVMNQNFPLIIGCFIFYFLFGYLLYGSLFAAVGSAVDSETDTQQFMLPLSLPLVIGFFAAQLIMQDPESQLGFWLSIVPFTSPVVMMVRVPFGVPVWELALSMGVLIITFIFMTWLAGRIYRTGILLYGKKASWRELGKWLFYKG